MAGIKKLLLVGCAVGFVIVMACPGNSTNMDKAWEALANLDIHTARPLFEQQLEKSPGDIEAMRGLLLSAYFDLDTRTAFKEATDLIQAAPGDPGLLPIYELLVDEFVTYSKTKSFSGIAGQAFADSGTGGMRYYGRAILRAKLGQTSDTSTQTLSHELGTEEGAWVIGPFDNRADIAAYRELPLETAPLDTTAVVSGNLGFRATWNYIRAGLFDEIDPSLTFGSDSIYASEVRSFFRLPQRMPITLIYGGASSSRIRIDGCVVSDDPAPRNAHLTGGIRLTLDAGPHEISAVIGTEIKFLNIWFAVVDTSYNSIPGLEWQRYAQVSYVDSLSSSRVNPIFDSFDKWSAAHPSAPDGRCLSAMLHMWNGYAPEIIHEFEPLQAEGKLTLLDTWVLYKALLLHNEKEEALKYLAVLKSGSDNPWVWSEWVSKLVSSHEDQIRICDSLCSVYPGRMPLELMASLKPLLSGDLAGWETNIANIVKEHPDESSLHLFLASFFAEGIGNNDRAYEELQEYYKETGDLQTFRSMQPKYLARLGKFDEALATARAGLEDQGTFNDQMFNVIDIAEQANLLDAYVPWVDSLAQVYPNNLMIQSLRNAMYNRTGRMEEARQVLTAIHRLKPTAVSPYKSLDSLHHNIPYDSLFGSPNVVSLWDVTPTPDEVAGSDYWVLYNRVQEIVFAGGVVYEDTHRAWVLLNQDAVQQFQSLNLGFTPGDNFYSLVLARRLRKNAPPLDADQKADQVIFKDLKPGDAVELRYRKWVGRSGDLWKDYWDTYVPYRSVYQRHWEFSVMSDRDDIHYAIVKPAKEPKASDWYGFKKLTWSGDKTSGVRLDAALLPPSEEMLGCIYLSTMRDWDVIRNWYRSVSDAILANNPRSEQLAKQLIAGATTDRQKLDILYRYVALTIPYQTIGFDYDGAIPQRPDQVLLNKWGDCKDKTHLLISFLRTAGMKAWPTLVLTDDEGSRLPIPQFSFDHEIVACVLNSDTIFIDPTSYSAEPMHTLSRGVAGQPCLKIDDAPSGVIINLPSIPPDQYASDAVLEATLADSGGCPFVYSKTSYNERAGGRRHDVAGQSDQDLLTEVASNLSSAWGISISLDSVSIDTVSVPDSVFSETWVGSIRLGITHIGKTTLVNLPAWESISTDLPTDLLIDQTKEYPAVLNSYCMRQSKVIKLRVPASFGTPQLSDAVSISKPLYSFAKSIKWDKSERVLTVEFDIEIKQGRCDRKAFADFSNQVITDFGTPLLFQ